MLSMTGVCGDACLAYHYPFCASLHSRGAGHTRRQMFHLALGAVLTACSLPSRAVEQSTETVADFISLNCSAYLRARGNSRAVMWRGGDGVGRVNPPPDLLDINTYPVSGVSYFRALKQCEDELQFRISAAHIGTGSKVSATQWGEPVSVWPIDAADVAKPFNFFFWEHHRLIWDEERDSSWESGEEILRGNGPVVRRVRLADALATEKEVIFEMNPTGLFVVPATQTQDVVQALDRI